MYSAPFCCLRAVSLSCAVLLQASAFGQALPATVAEPVVAPAAPATPAFDILEFQIEGNSVLTAADIERAVTPFLGENRQLADVEAARVALEKVYQSAGFLTVFVDVPEQRIDSGIVVLNVTEGRVERLKVTGSRYFSQGYIRDKVPELANGKVPNFNELQRQLATVNRTEERRVQPIMRAGVTPGTVETELKVDDRLPLAGSVELSNRAAAATKPLRLSVSAHYDNLFQLDHSVAVSLSTAPQDVALSRVFSLNYTIPGDQATWVGYVVNSKSSVAALGDVNVLGKGTTLGLRYVRPLGSAADEVHSISLGIDYKDLTEDTRNGDSTISTPLRYLPLQFAYNASIDHGAQRQTQMSLQATAAFRQILQREVDCPGGRADQFACKRQGGDGGFATLRADVRHIVGVAGFGSLHLRLGGQMGTGPVPSGEQYTIGGAETVRGYYEAEGAGDRGVLGSIEWRSVDLSGRISRWFGAADSDNSKPAQNALSQSLSQSYALAFVDVARTYVFEPATGQAPHTSLAGIGLGLRTKVRKSVTGEFDLAWPLNATSATVARSPRAHVKLAVDF